MKILLPLIAAVLLGAQTLPPVDESASDPSFLAYRTQLLSAVERRNVPALLALVSPKVRTSFGAEDSVAFFRRHWNLDRPAQSKLWNELGTVLRLGATRDENDFIAPYVFTRFPTTLDAYSHSAVIRSGVPLRRSPAPAAPQVATLDHDIVELYGERKAGWVRVRNSAGVSGWVEARHLRSPLEYRAFFEKVNGAWKLTAFISGD